MGNLDKILAEFEKLKGQHVIVEWDKVERLIAVGDDEEDWYWITWDGRKISWHSCLMHIIPLKGKIRKKDYDMIIHMAEMNHYDSPKLWGNKNDNPEVIDINKKAKVEAETPMAHCKFITPFCWDIN